MRQTVRFLSCLTLVALLFAGVSLKAQVFYNNGASIHATEGALVFVDGIVQNQSGQIEVDENAGNNAEFIVQDDFINNATAGGNGYYRILGDWINNNTFNAGNGTVFLEGGNQLLDGSVSTTFNNLTLDGTGLKTQTIDQYCVGILDLKDLELQNETHGFFIQNTDVNAITRTTGFVSALDGGFLSRQINAAASYLFPVGSSIGTIRYRPVELTPEDNSANTYTVRLANVLATTEGYDVSNLPLVICEVNPEFYHQIDRTAGTAASDINVFYNETEDGVWDGLASWTTTPDLWDIILGTLITPGAPFNEALVSTWNNFIELPYILYRVQPEANITDPGAFCENDAAIDLTATDPGGTWSGNGITDPVIGTFDPATATAGTHTITYDIGTGSCTATDQIDITVNAIPEATITDPGDFCANDAAMNLTAATPGGTWSGDGITDAVNGTFDPSSALYGANSVDYQITTGGCTGTDNIIIQVNALPSVNAGADFAVCEGDDINLTETGGDATTWTWTGPGVFSPGANAQNPLVLSATAANDGTYTVEIEDGNGCIATDDVIVTVNALPTVPTANIDCSGGIDAGIITVTSPLGANYEYSIDGTTFQAGTSFGPLTNGNYTITVEDITSGCTTTGGNINLDCGCANPTELTLNSLSGSTCVETAFSQSGNTFGGSATEVNLAHDGDGSLNATNFITSPFEFIYTPAITDAGNTISITVTTDNPLGAPCATAQETFTLSVRNIPLVTANSNEPVCEGTDIELSEIGGAATTWAWSGPGTFSPDANAQNPNIIGATAADAGTYTVVITDAFGCTATDDVAVAINSSPAVNAGADFAVCEGDDINLTETGGDATTWTWTGPGTFSPDANAQNPDVLIATSANDGIYTVEIEDVNGCIATDDVIVTVNATPDATITDPGDFCANDAAMNLTAATSGGTWSGDGITDGVNGIFDPSSALIGTNGVNYQVTIGGCTGIDNISIQVNDLPTVDAGADFAVCEGDDINLTETGGDASTWTWTGPGTFSPDANAQNPSVFSATAANDGTYTVEVEDGNGCISTDDVIVTVNATPDASITDPGDFCSDDAVMDLSAATAGGTWSGPGITDGVNGTFDPSAASIGANSITYEVTVSGCIGADNISIDVFDTPDATITDPGDFCSDDAAMDLSAATAGGTWFGTGITDATNGTFDPTSVTPGTYTITYNVGTGTCSDSDNVDITVNATPDASITDPGDFCSDDAVMDLSAATAGGTWSGPGITDGVNGTFDPSAASIGANSITYEVTVSGCTGTDNISIDVFDTPDATITDPGIICITNAAFNLDAVTDGGIWTGNGITDNNAGTFDPTIAGLGIHLVTYQVVNASCSDSDQINIEVIDTPDASIIPAGPFCQNDPPVNLEAATPGGVWSGSGIVNETEGTFNPSQAHLGENSIRYTVSVGGCTATSQTIIKVLENSDVSIVPVGPYCFGGFTVQLEVNTSGGDWMGSHVNDEGVFSVATAGAGTHSVIYSIPGTCGDSDTISIVVFPSNFVVDYSVTKPNCFGAADAQIDFSVLGGTPPYTYSWSNLSVDTSRIVGLNSGIYHFSISDMNGCEINLETINIPYGSRECLRIPNAFTPNGDNVNDEFIIENIMYYPESVLQIFNRWGQLLYEGGPNADPWDGTFNGTLVPTGSYIYVLALKSELEDVVGVVTLVR